MSAEHAIDLDAIKQAIFKNKLPDFLKHTYFWMITDQKSNVLSCSSCKDVHHFLNPMKLSTENNNRLFSVELVVEPSRSVAVALESITFTFPIKNNLFSLKLFFLLKNTNIKFRLFNSVFFNRRDRFYNYLDFINAVKKLKNTNPLTLLTDNEWVIAWLVIHGLTNTDIANITDRSIYTIKDRVSRILGINKLELFNRYLLSDVGFYLNWDCYVPLSLIKNTVHKNTL